MCHSIYDAILKTYGLHISLLLDNKSSGVGLMIMSRDVGY